MRTFALIFARGGSKGLPGKNIRPLGGKPLIAWSIEQALAVRRIEKVIVSTDSPEIASVARDYGAEVPFLRPSELAQDDSPEWLAWQHALSYLSSSIDGLPEIMLSVPTTAPLRYPMDIELCIDEYEKGDADVIITVTDAHRSPYFNMVKTNMDGSVGLVNQPQAALFHRQLTPVVFDMTTVCYAVSPKFVLAHNSIFEGRVKAVHIPIERAIDIDTQLDFHMAESLLRLRE